MHFIHRRMIVAVAILAARPLLGLDQKATDALVKTIDDRQRNSGDYHCKVFIDQKEKNSPPKPLTGEVYRRDEDDKWMILFTAPTSEAGKGYLRLDKNLFSYEPPPVAKWERRTERASIMGTSSRRDDFDESRLSEEYTVTFIGDEALGKHQVHHIKLAAKPGADVASPVIELWVDQMSQNVLKRQEFALSGKLLRTSYYPEWDKLFSKSKGADVYVPKRILIYDEVEKENQTTIVISDPKLDPLEKNMFTKAWFEQRSKS